MPVSENNLESPAVGAATPALPQPLHVRSPNFYPDLLWKLADLRFGDERRRDRWVDLLKRKSHLDAETPQIAERRKGPRIEAQFRVTVLLLDGPPLLIETDTFNLSARGVAFHSASRLLPGAEVAGAIDLPSGTLQFTGHVARSQTDGGRPHRIAIAFSDAPVEKIDAGGL